MAELQTKLEEYLSRERQIAEVMINAQISAQKIEAQARAKVEILLQETDEELRRKNQELELLRIKSQLFKQELNDRLLRYDDIVLNDIFPFDIIEPNHESIARYFYNTLEDTLSLMGLTLKEITVRDSQSLIMEVNRRIKRILV